jgi:type II secretory pathway predicted ATPase ExeA
MVFNVARTSNTGNSESLYLGGQYAEILDFLCSPLTGPANVKVLVSEPGLGKTVLLRSALERIKIEARAAFVFWTLFKPADFVTHLLFQMGSSEPPPSDLEAAQRQFDNLLRRAAEDGKRFVLAIDEAHNLSPATLRSLSTLLDRNTAGPPQITLLLAGLPGLHDRLAHPEASGIKKRIAGVMTIAPLNPEQTTEYIDIRLTALGIGTVPPEQLANIAASSGGIVRTIDKLCHRLRLQKESGHEGGVDPFRVDSTVNESPTTDVAVARIAAWAADHTGMWCGTTAELAAATGISVEQICDAVENRTQELLSAGIAASVQRAPGRPRMVMLAHLEQRQQTPESHLEILELPEEPANPEPKLERQEMETKPGPNQASATDTSLESKTAVEEPSSPNRRVRWALRVAGALAVILGIAGGFLYFSPSKTAPQASSVSQREFKPKPSPKEDELTGLRKRAEAGDVGSQTALADRFREGNGVLQDEKAALALYEQAATQGDSVAQHRLGLALSSGSGGVAVDRVAAYAWLVMARNRGQTIDQATLDSLTRSLTPREIVDVRHRLGRMYEHGIGCVPDLVLADQWFLLGAAAGDPRNRAASAALEQRMSPGQISLAHARSDDWLRRHTIKETSTAAAR